MLRRLLSAAVAMVLLASLPAAAAKENTIAAFGSYMPTYMGIEYERRIGAWGIGVETGLLPIGQTGGQVRLGITGRYYIDLKSPVSPFISLSPGLIMSWYDVSSQIEPSADLYASFFAYGAVGLEYRIGIIRAAVEIGGGFDTMPEPAGTHGYFVFKGGIGLSF